MERLVQLYRGLEERGVKSIIRSAWLHHRFTQIHPFQDGNGRIARALSAFVLIEGGLFPVVVNRDDRPQYIANLEEADAGDLSPLVSLWSNLQSREITRALSLAEGVTAPEPQKSPLNPLQIIAAAGDRLRQLRTAAEQARQQVLVTADKVHERASNYTSLIVDALNKQFSQDDPTYHAVLEISNDETSHWFHRQIIEIAREFEYFADLVTYHKWIRLQIQAQRRYEITLSIHGLGRIFSGAMVVTGYFAERLLDEDYTSVSSDPRPIFENIFIFSHQQPVDDVLKRFNNWLENSMTIAMEMWRTQL